MTRKPVSNISESVRQKLLNQSNLEGQDFQLFLNRFFRERFLYRLGESEYKGRYFLKGAALLELWEKNPYRSTMDLDLLRTGGGSMDAMAGEFRNICGVKGAEDGVEFDPGSISVEPIRAELPVMLKMPAPKIWSYAPETVIAEKFEAMVVLGIANSRIKDFFDLAHLAALLRFEGKDIREAISRTFAKRKTPIPEELPIGLGPEYWEWQGREQQVKAFSKRARLNVSLADAKMLTP